MKPQISSTKSTFNRLLVSRWGVVIAVLAVLAAGCSQSEDAVSEGSGSTTSSSEASLSSAASLSPAAENTATSTSLSEQGATTTQASVEEESSGLGSEIATTSTSLSSAETEDVLPDEAVVEGALSDEAIRLIDVSVDACADLLGFRCGRALWDACAVLHEDFENVSEEEDSVSADEADEVSVMKEVVSYVKDRVCRFMDLAFYSELSAVLSARYGEAYYKLDEGFYGYRDQFAAFSGVHEYVSLSDEGSPEIFDALPEGYGTRTEWGRNYIPEVVRPKLGQLFISLYTYAISETSVNLKSEDEVSRILAEQKAIEAVGQCNAINNLTFGGPLNIRNLPLFNSNLNQCIGALCDQKSGINAIGCYTGRVTIETKEYNYLSEEYEENTRVSDDLDFSKGVLFWQILKYVCATAEIHDSYFVGDDCRRAAFYICQYWNAVGFSSSDDITDIGFPACKIGNVARTVSYTAAIDACYDQLETFLTTKFLLFSTTNFCGWATEECAKYENVKDRCHVYGNFFAFEIIWKNIPFLCADNDSSVLSFSDSNCYTVLKQSCRPAPSGNYSGVYSRYHPNLAVNEIRSGYDIRRALCSYLFYPYERDNVSDVARSNNLIYRPQISSKIQVDKDFSNTTISLETTIQNEFPSDDFEPVMLETIPREFPSANIDLINVAVTECAKGQNPQSECIEKIWQSCFNILRTDPNINWELALYVCGAAWIAELARMASVLLSSFPEDYQAGNFSRFLEFVTAYAVGEDLLEGILTIDENGKAQPNLNQEGLTSEITEALLALGTNIAQLVQPYLNLPATNPQRNT